MIYLNSFIYIVVSCTHLISHYLLPVFFHCLIPRLIHLGKATAKCRCYIFVLHLVWLYLHCTVFLPFVIVVACASRGG